jgi:hypothetical protein
LKNLHFFFNKKEQELDEVDIKSTAVLLAGDLPDPEPEVGKIVNLQPTTSSIQSGVVNQQQKS